ncbi:hypothetical protein [Streptomyces turgidiscabies]|uniref:hypothetical protein n=1 Tax=Streptomyces turgidiscabies TaxID=85558 RepID=UPI0038F63A1F
MSPLARLRLIAQPGHGRRRAGRRPHLVIEAVPLNVLMQPTEAMVNDLAWCPAEQKKTLHAFFRLGGRECWTCRSITPHHPLTSTPRPGGVV